MDLTGELVRALHCAVALAAAQVTWSYGVHWVVEVRADPHAGAWRYMLWIWAFAGSQLVSFGPLLLSYLLGARPEHVPGLPDGARLAALTAELLAFCGVWADIRRGRFMQRSLIALLAAAAVLVAIFMSPYPFPEPA